MGLALGVAALLLSLVFGLGTLTQVVLDRAPLFVQDSAPPSELPAKPGFRTVWVDPRSSASVPRPGDVVLERVVAASEPFAAHHPEPLYQAAFMARRCQFAVIVTLATASDGATGATFVEDASGTVDEVLVDHTAGGIGVGSTLRLAAHEGTHVTRVGTTQVVERYSYVRAPKAGWRYLVFVGYRGAGSGGSTAARIGYGNTFEIRGRTVVGMTVPGSAGWHQGSSLERVRAVVRRRGALPPPQQGDWEEKEELLR